MAGIINYYHGESGSVADRFWGLTGEFLAFHIELAGDPHRSLAWDYGGDIGIDPEIQPGDHAVYLRLEDTSGIWVRPDCQSAAELRAAIGRVLQNRRLLEQWAQADGGKSYADVAQEIFETSDQPLRVAVEGAGEAALAVVSAGWGICTAGGPPPEETRAAASFFLSHAAEDTLLARRIFADMTTDAHADVWFDLNQPQDGVPETDEAITEWLRRSIHGVDGFVVLWTEHAASSDWVRRELGWAREQRRSRSDFHLLVLKLHDIDVPSDLLAESRLIDCDGIWWSNGINEELYAAIFRRQGRREWLAALPPDAPASNGTMIGFTDFASDAGVVVDFRWKLKAETRAGSEPSKCIRWQLDYVRRNGEHRHVEGGGDDKPADLGMKPGDRLGFFNVRWRRNTHVRSGPGLWMRSADLGITPDAVLDHYYEAGR